MKPKIKRPTYVLLPGKVYIRYCDIAHHPGGILYWIDGKGKFRSLVSTGAEYHHNLDGRMNMDSRWRGRIDLERKIATMMPPLGLYTVAPEKILLPGWIVARLRKLGAKVIYVDTAVGMRKVVRVTGTARVGI